MLRKIVKTSGLCRLFFENQGENISTLVVLKHIRNLVRISAILPHNLNLFKIAHKRTSFLFSYLERGGAAVYHGVIDISSKQNSLQAGQTPRCMLTLQLTGVDIQLK